MIILFINKNNILKSYIKKEENSFI